MLKKGFQISSHSFVAITNPPSVFSEKDVKIGFFLSIYFTVRKQKKRALRK